MKGEERVAFSVVSAGRGLVTCSDSNLDEDPAEDSVS